MKTNFLLIIAILLSLNGIKAQEIMKFNNQGYLGIGTSEPTQRLTVDGNLRVQRSAGTNQFMNVVLANDENAYLNFGLQSGKRIGFQINGGSQMSILDNGYVGIGTNTPQHKLTVEGTFRTQRESTGQFMNVFLHPQGNTFLNFGGLGQNNFIAFQINSGKIMHISEDELEVYGNISVQGGSFIDDGTIIADYVFDESYQLMPMEEQGLFMRMNKHLPKVDSEKKIKLDGSYDMARRREQILEEVEKAHLYIQQLNKMYKILDKKNQEMFNMIKELVSENKELKKEITQLKKS